MRTIAVAIIAFLLAPATVLSQQPTDKGTMQIPRYALTALAPVFIVDAVEPSLEFWSDRLGFTKENEVRGPDGKLIFGSVTKDGVEIMYQSRASVIAADPESAAELTGRSAVLFITVPSLADLETIERATKGAPVVKTRHDTTYGTNESREDDMGGKDMEGSEEQKREAARDAREEGKRPSEAGATTGATQQRTEAKPNQSHQEKIDLKREGKPEQLTENTPETRPGSRDADSLDRERYPRMNEE